MRKFTFLALLCLTTMFTTAQISKENKFVAVGMSLSNDHFTEQMEIGAIYGKNALSLVGTVDNLNHSAVKNYTAGVKYARNLVVQQPISISANAALRVNLTGKTQFLILEPGASVNLRLFKGFSLRADLSSPIYEKRTSLSSLELSGGLNVVLSL